MIVSLRRVSVPGSIAVAVGLTAFSLFALSGLAGCGYVAVVGGSGVVSVSFALSDSTGDQHDVNPFFRVR